MLSYRHAFHAGNFADVLKHLVLVEILTYLQRKDTPLDYIDTHAGAGLYRLTAAPTRQLMEYADGIGRLYDLDWPELVPYLDLIKTLNRPGKLEVYPGSPALAQALLRPQDRAWLYELHPTDFRTLVKNSAKRARTKVLQEDSFTAVPGLLPPLSRRGLVLIDPSSEVKADYSAVVRLLEKAHRRFAGGTYGLWYPVVDRRQIERMERELRATGIPHIQRFELGVAADGAKPGMTASGMIVINPTWGLLEKMEALLPRLAQVLGDDSKRYRCDVLARE